MKIALLFLGAGGLLLATILSKAWDQAKGYTIDLHLGDTYYIITFWLLSLFILLFLTSLFAIGGVLGTRFRSKPFLFLLIVLFLLDVIVWYTFGM